MKRKKTQKSVTFYIFRHFGSFISSSLWVISGACVCFVWASVHLQMAGLSFVCHTLIGCFAAAGRSSSKSDRHFTWQHKHIRSANTITESVYSKIRKLGILQNARISQCFFKLYFTTFCHRNVEIFRYISPAELFIFNHHFNCWKIFWKILLKHSWIWLCGIYYLVEPFLYLS